MSNRAKIITSISIGVAIITLVVIGLILNRSSDDGNQNPGTDFNGSTQDDEQTIEEAPVTKNPEEAQLNSAGDSKYIPIISRVGQDSAMVQVRAYVATFDKGVCTLEMTQGESKMTKEVGVTSQPSYLQCDGFDVQKSELGKNGEWVVKVIYTINGKNYESEQQTFTVL